MLFFARAPPSLLRALSLVHPHAKLPQKRFSESVLHFRVQCAKLTNGWAAGESPAGGERLATTPHRESCVCGREVVCEALTAERAGGAIEHRKEDDLERRGS